MIQFGRRDMEPRRPGAPRWGGAREEEVSAARQALVARALAALSSTPATIAAAEGLDPTDVPLLLAGVGDPEDADRLAQALARAGAELEELARELSTAAREGRL